MPPEEEERPRAINLGHSVCIMRTDGIVFVQCVDTYYGKKECEQITRAIGELSGDKRVPVLIVGSHYSSIDKEGRDFSASAEGSRFSSAEAYIIKSMAQKILANFYLKMNRPVVPSRFFKEIKEGEEWLHSLTANEKKS
ncbi:MAG: hypothetical protein IAF38_16425 [Bacteroidia bacterium]|nr:hypothetical protein [Bacteroidia bacterium]